MAAVTAILAITGPHLADLPGQDNPFRENLTAAGGALYYGSAALVYALPAVVGIFWGAPLVTRELETGTHRLV
ncbi:hypothetical protein GCM10009678_19670 [Actinomadura kijaniata]|uniref:Uncharacterized protein n=1 Tax=Actinomadura namibiensis TaxID=182080 RepID=A0A7W3LXQ7_ACTNM|nr:hypothetical protein [Actinomadura namibiensis]MBA8956211.1 hypothetical protein [Actinomadura namibiensis]